MKKGLALLLALVLAAGLLGCGSAAGEDSRLTAGPEGAAG